MREANAMFIEERIRRDNGATFDNNATISPYGYIVGGVVKAVETPLSTFTFRDIVSFVTDNVEHEMFGAWIKNGIVYLDVVEVFESFDMAAFIADERNEKAIYDGIHDVEIPTQQAINMVAHGRR